jgi:LPS-assembly protein
MSEAWADARPGKLWLFTSAAALALVATSASAQSSAGGAAPSSSGPATNQGADGLAPGAAYLESDSLSEDRNSGIWTARGRVESRYENRVVRADEVIYNTRTGVVNARGNVQLINEDGSIQYADETSLTEDFRAGVALGFATRLPGNITIAAASAVRRSEELSELNNAIYTACNLCASDGDAKSPTWSVQATRVTQDRANQVVVYRNAVFRVKDVPIFYAPVFWHPDPQAERRSGFLSPDIGVSDRRGLTYEQPYVWVISPSQDLVVSPQINTKVNPFLNGEHRKRFYSGVTETRFGYTYEQDFNEEEKFGDTTSRSYVLGRGAFDINEDWRWGYTVERTSDDLIFDKYDISDVYALRGLYQPDDRRLLTQAHVERQTRLSYASAAVLSFQDLRDPTFSRLDNASIPLVAPLVEARWEPPRPVLGGRLRLRGSTAVLERDLGKDSRRATGEVDWRRVLTLNSGVRFEPFGMARADAYSIGGEALAPGESTFNGGKTRAFATAGADVSWPLIRPTRTGSIIVEPLLQFVASNTSDRDEEIPNEDSVSFEFDETTLFEPNKFPGFDRFEGGLRLNAGVRATADWGRGLNASVLIGRSFRAEEDLNFRRRSGLRETKSDWVVAATARPLESVFLRTRARLDGDTLEVRRLETNGYLSFRGAFVGFNHLRDEPPDGPLEPGEQDFNQARHELDAFGGVPIYRRLSLIAAAQVDLRSDTWRRGEVGIRYRDECTEFDIVYERENTFNRTLGPSDSIRVRLTLATLGDVQQR